MGTVLFLTESKHPPRAGGPSARYRRGTGNVLAEHLLEAGHEPIMWWDHPLGPCVVESPDVVLLRSGLPVQLARARALAARGTRVVNDPDYHAAAADKQLQARRFEEAGLAHPRTGGPWIPGEPVVVKPRRGSSGHGVRLGRAGAVMCGPEEIQQAFVEAERELRAIVVGEEVLAWSRRRPAPGDFRANLAQGGTMEPIEQPPEGAEELAVAATRLLGLELAGVDLLVTGEGPLVLEVNAATTLHGPTPAATREVLEAIERLLRLPGPSGRAEDTMST